MVVLATVHEEQGGVCIVARGMWAFGIHTWVKMQHHAWAQVPLCNYSRCDASTRDYLIGGNNQLNFGTSATTNAHNDVTLPPGCSRISSFHGPHPRTPIPEPIQSIPRNIILSPALQPIPLLKIIQVVNGLFVGHQTNSVFINGFSSYCSNCHVCALFINGHRLAINSHVRERDVVLPCVLRQHELESLVWQVLQVEQARPPPLTSGYAGQAQSCSSLVNVFVCAPVYGQSDGRWTAIVRDFNAYWDALPTDGCMP